MKVYVIYRAHGYEGCTIPEAVFSTIEKAHEYVNHIDKSKIISDIDIEELELDSWNYYEYKKI